MGAPADLKAHYTNYPKPADAVLDKTGFTVRISLLDQRLELPLPCQSVSVRQRQQYY